MKPDFWNLLAQSWSSSSVIHGGKEDGVSRKSMISTPGGAARCAGPLTNKNFFNTVKQSYAENDFSALPSSCNIVKANNFTWCFILYRSPQKLKLIVKSEFNHVTIILTSLTELINIFLYITKNSSWHFLPEIEKCRILLQILWTWTQ